MDATEMTSMDTPSVVATLVSIQVGMPRQIEDEDGEGGKVWRTAYFKEPVSGPIWLGATNLVGDGQADKRNHGGPDQALLAYSADHYPIWHDELGVDLPYGAFGENFTISGLDETSVCIGDTYAIGEVRIQVTQPRGPCSNIGRRWGIKDLTKRVEVSGRTGWYLRVLREGYVAAGQPVALIAQPHPNWNVTAATRTIRSRHRHATAAQQLLAVPELGIRTRETLSGF